MTDQLDPALLELQREYLASMPGRLEELRVDIKALSQGSLDAAGSLRARLHRLAGSGGSFGFSALSAIAQEAERWLMAHPAPADTTGLSSIVERLTKAVARAATQLPTAGGEPPAPVPRALVIMRPSPQRERIAQELEAAGYDVRFSTRQDDPGATPVEELPHLIVIGGEAGDGDLSAIASAWTNSPYRRPGAVVLVETLRPVDRLRAVAAGVDAVFPVEQVEQKLPRYARTFARIGPPPSSVLLAHHDPTMVAGHISALEQAHVRVTRCLPAHAILDTLERELPDLLLMETRLPGSDGFALARMVQQDPRFHLLPVIFIGEESIGDRISALKAGADDYFPSSASSELLVQMVIAHATRGRRLREMIHRDGLTGLLNHATLMAELESAVDFSQRHGEPLAFVLFELDGFRRLSERLGPRAGEEILLHVAGVFRSNVRASDVIGRYGWEAFGMLLRGSSASGAAVLADKLHQVLGEQPAKTTGGEIIPLPVRVGSAVFPRDGTTAAELAQAADRALRRGGKQDTGSVGP
ncbi:MAG TPA: diguanylate cyclase [Gemmatimonadales bacterium]|jgi:diguanylate cyclase (GGDEF)-like protein|nr:diguanylate cyclase [Gemmatimonadales bacterium]